MTVYDYSFARPDPAALDEGVMRYLCPLPNSKALHADELAQLHAAGKPVGLVWENDTNDIDGGYDQGHNFGSQARAQARALGFPDEVPIYWAVDKRLTNVTRNTALDYGRGFADAAGASRPYGEAALIDAAVALGITDGGWCPTTWGASDHVVLSQVVGASDVPGTDANNVRRADWGGWHPDAHIATTGEDMPLTDPEIEKIAARVTAWLANPNPGYNESGTIIQTNVSGAVGRIETYEYVQAHATGGGNTTDAGLIELIKGLPDAFLAKLKAAL